MSGATSLVADIKGSATNGRAVPQLAMVTAGLAALIGLLWAITSIKSLVDVFRLGDLLGSLGASFTIALILVVVVGLAVAALWLAIAWLVRGGSRVALPLIYVAGAASILGGGNGGYELRGAGALGVVSRLLAIGVIGMTFIPEVRAHLTGTPADGRPTTLVGGEALLLWFGVTSAFLAVAYLLLGVALSDSQYLRGSGSFYLVAITTLVAAVVALVFARAVGKADPAARLIVSGTAVVFLILMAVGDNLGGAWYQIVTLVGTAALLWLMPDARFAFGDAPLDTSKMQGRGAQAPAAAHEQPVSSQEPPAV